MQLHPSRRIFNGALYAALVCVILFFAPILHVEFELPKVALFRICVWVMALALAHIWLFEGIIHLPKLVKKPQMYIAGLGLLTIGALGVLVSPVPEISFQGSYERFDGLKDLFYLYGFFLLLILGIQDKQVFEKGLRVLGWSMLIVFIYAFLQKFGMDPFGYNLQEISLGRVFSTLGHPNFLASVIVICALPMTAYWHKKSGKYAAILCVAVIIALMLWTGSRAGILGLLTAFFGYLILKKLWLKAILSLVAIVITGALVYGHNSWLTAERSANYRLIMWEETAEMIMEKPLFGSGKGTFALEFQKNVPKEMVPLEESNVIADKPHNITLEILFDGGLMALVAWVSAIFTLLWVGLRGNKQESIAIIASVVGLLVTYQFGFATIADTVILAFMLGYLIFIGSGGVDKIKIKRYGDRLIRILILALVSVLAFLAIFCQAVIPLLADYYAEKGLQSLEESDANGTIANLKVAADLNNKTSFYGYILAEALIQVRDYGEAEIYLDLAGKISNFQDGYYYFLRGKMLEAKGNGEAENEYKKALKFSPNYPLFWLNLGIFQAKKPQLQRSCGISGDLYKSFE